MTVTLLLSDHPDNAIYEIKQDKYDQCHPVQKIEDLYSSVSKDLIEKFGKVKLNFVDYWKHGFNYIGEVELPEKGKFKLKVWFYAQDIYRIPMQAATSINQNLYLQGGSDNLEIQIQFEKV